MTNHLFHNKFNITPISKNVKNERFISMKYTILYEDSDLLVCLKPAGVAAQNERGFQPAMTDLLKQHLTKQNGKKGDPYLGIIHRLDKPVGGIMVYAKTKTAAASLSKQITFNQIKKHYYAVLSATPLKPSATLTDYLVHDKKNNYSFISEPSNPKAKKAELSYQILKQISLTQGEQTDILTLVHILLKTGRHHQIRVQFSNLGCPLYGDLKYNPTFKPIPSLTQKNSSSIALYSYCLEFIHPKTGKVMQFSQVPSDGIWKLFAEFS